MTSLAERQTDAPALPLRPYQREAIDAVRAVWEEGRNRVAVILPTGAGKTVVFSHMVAEESGRTLVLAHRKELVEQAATKIQAIDPGIRVGIDMASRRADGECRAVVASVQTLASQKRIGRWDRDAFSQVIVDECHHALAKTYRDILDYFRCFDSGGTKTLGVTATLARGDDKGLGQIWPEVAYERSILEMVADGFLVRPKGISAPLDSLDMSKVAVAHGDYTASSLEEQLVAAKFAEAVATAYREYAADRPGIVFTPTVATAHMAVDALRAAGFKAEAVWGDMDSIARETAVEGFKDGHVQILCNCMVLTEGFDAPRASCCVVVRPTQSAPLYIQMVGRVLRPHLESGKTDALVLDLVKASKAHKIVTLRDLSIADEDEGEPADDDEDEPEDDGPKKQAARKTFFGRTEEVDLFSTSRSVWLQTKAGHRFVPAGDGYVALYTSRAKPGMYAVAMFPAGKGRPHYVTGALDDMALAMALGEERAEAAERASGKHFSTSSRSAAWRAKRPSDKTIEAAVRMGVTVPPGARQGEVSDLMTAKIASRRIDRHFGGRAA